MARKKAKKPYTRIGTKEKENSSAGVEVIEPQTKACAGKNYPGSSSKKRAKERNQVSITPRRSSRLKSPSVSMIQEILIDQDDRQDDLPINEDPISETPRINIDVEAEENNDSETDRVEKTVENLLNRVYSEKPVRKPSSAAEPQGVVGYKSLYFDSQKQISALKEENLRLSLKLEYAHGKLDVYEKGHERGTSLCSDVLMKVKDIISAVQGPGTSSPRSVLEAAPRKTTKRKKKS